jgi:hypothetical protein
VVGRVDHGHGAHPWAQGGHQGLGKHNGIIAGCRTIHAAPENRVPTSRPHYDVNSIDSSPSPLSRSVFGFGVQRLRKQLDENQPVLVRQRREPRNRGRGRHSRPFGAGENIGSLARTLPKQLRQPRNVDRDAPRLVLREHLRLQRLGLGLPRADVGERLPVRVPDDIAARNLVRAPGCGEAAALASRPAC